MRNFSDDVTVSNATIDRRFQRDNLILHSSNGGKESSLAKYEPYFVDMIIKLARCRHSITCSEGLGLINSLIQKKEIQNEVIQWKMQNTYVNNITNIFLCKVNAGFDAGVLYCTSKDDATHSWFSGQGCEAQ